MGDYGPSKAGLEHFCRTVATEEAEKGVRANVIAPGVIATEAFTGGATDKDRYRLDI